MHSWIRLTRGADKSWVLLQYSSYSTTNLTALVPAACWSYYRALSARRCTENLTYVSNPVGLLPSPNPWILYTEQGVEYVFAKVIAVLMYHRFSMVVSVCVNWNQHGRKSMLFSTNVGSWLCICNLILQRLCVNEVVFIEYWLGRRVTPAKE